MRGRRALCFSTWRRHVCSAASFLAGQGSIVSLLSWQLCGCHLHFITSWCSCQSTMSHYIQRRLVGSWELQQNKFSLCNIQATTHLCFQVFKFAPHPLTLVRGIFSVLCKYTKNVCLVNVTIKIQLVTITSEHIFPIYEKTYIFPKQKHKIFKTVQCPFQYVTTHKCSKIICAPHNLYVVFQKLPHTDHTLTRAS